MRLNLSEIIEVPGGSVPFQCDLNTELFDFPAVERFNSPVTATGTIVNSAGALSLKADIIADMEVSCDRCLKVFGRKKTLAVDAPLAAELIDEESAEIFLLDGDFLDVSEVLTTLFILDMETSHLCSDDCQGLCHKCGADLNLGSCDCKKDVDPRLAVLEQLLDDKDSQT